MRKEGTGSFSGPWSVEVQGLRTTAVGSPEGFVCFTHGDERGRANARLIAAAPELLEACEALLKAQGMQQGRRGGGTMGQISLAIDKAREALTKAGGRI